MLDLLITNALVQTLDPQRPAAEAVAICANRIVAVGSSASLAPLATPATKTINAQGRLVLPGFNDAHVHFLTGGLQLSGIELRPARSPAEFADRIAQFAAHLTPGQWITGGDWDHEAWPGAPLPTRELIDSVTPHTPVFVQRLDGHMGLANGLALQMAQITRHTPDPPGGLIVRHPQTGEPTGLLKDAAMSLVQKLIPTPTFQEKLAAAAAASQHAASLGVTSVQDVSAGSDVGVYQELLRTGQLKTRIYAIWPITRWSELARTGLRAPFGDSMLRVGGLKGFADGSLGSSTALFFEPYQDDPANYGLPADEMIPEDIMLERVLQADRAGLQILLHAIGDQANDHVLGLFQQVARENGPRDRRFRIEHAQHLRRQDIPRFAPAGVIASMQPYHLADDGRWAEKRIGPERAKTTYAFRSLLEAKVILAFGSDWTVAPLDPIQGIAAAVTRQTLDHQHPQGWIPAEKITVEQAVRAYTIGSAYAEFAETDKGTLSPGKLADLTMLSQNIFTIPAAQISQTRVLLTVVNGKIAYQSSSANP